MTLDFSQVLVAVMSSQLAVSAGAARELVCRKSVLLLNCECTVKGTVLWKFSVSVTNVWKPLHTRMSDSLMRT